MKNQLLIFLLLIILGCSAKPEPINYTQDACYFCKMNIVDRVHAAEIVTKKSKVYKFDAIECMVNFLKDFDNSKVELFLSNNYQEPEILIDATQATFLISKNITSPMGAFLSAFKNRNEAQKTLDENGGKLYTWSELLHHLN